MARHPSPQKKRLSSNRSHSSHPTSLLKGVTRKTLPQSHGKEPIAEHELEGAELELAEEDVRPGEGASQASPADFAVDASEQAEGAELEHAEEDVCTRKGAPQAVPAAELAVDVSEHAEGAEPEHTDEDGRPREGASQAAPAVELAVDASEHAEGAELEYKEDGRTREGASQAAPAAELAVVDAAEDAEELKHERASIRHTTRCISSTSLDSDGGRNIAINEAPAVRPADKRNRRRRRFAEEDIMSWRTSCCM